MLYFEVARVVRCNIIVIFGGPGPRWIASLVFLSGPRNSQLILSQYSALILGVLSIAPFTVYSVLEY